jgi:hypothetical protein
MMRIGRALLFLRSKQLCGILAGIGENANKDH